MMAHCWELAPGGVSQLSCQSPKVALTTPCALAGATPAPSMLSPTARAPSALSKPGITRVLSQPPQQADQPDPISVSGGRLSTVNAGQGAATAASVRRPRR